MPRQRASSSGGAVRRQALFTSRPGAGPSRSDRRLWLPRFALQRFPITNRAWLAFLNDLLAQGREEEALAHAPWDTAQGEVERMLYGRDAAGRFVLAPDRDGHTWEPDWPVAMVTWHAARAYAAWRARRDGLPWRLPFDPEWSKAARGVDGRVFPWGFQAEACWARMVNSQAGPPSRVPVDSYPVDESVYGVRGLGGNSRDWCLDAYRREGPSVDERGRALLVPAEPESDDFRLIRGGSWASAAHLCRSTVRFAGRPGLRNSVVGVRLAMSV